MTSNNYRMDAENVLESTVLDSGDEYIVGVTLTTSHPKHSLLYTIYGSSGSDMQYTIL